MRHALVSVVIAMWNTIIDCLRIATVMANDIMASVLTDKKFNLR